MKLWIACAPLVLSACALVQAAEKPAFEVASIKPSEPQPMGMMRIMMRTDGGMLRYSNVSLKDCIRNAYRVKDFQVEGPDWLSATRYEITAKFPDGATEEQVPEMLQALLADRFKLTLHRETKDHAIYSLVVGKGGPKLKAADPSTEPLSEKELKPPPPGKIGAVSAPRGGMMLQMDQAGAHLKANGVTLQGVAEAMSRFSERPIVDNTGITGRYDFDLVFSPETIRGLKMMAGGQPAHPPAGGDGSSAEAPSDPAGSLVDSVTRYGLKLEPKKAPMEILIVDHIEKTPTEN